MNHPKKVVVYHKLSRCFCRNANTGPENNKDLFCKYPEDAYDFGSLNSARNWADASGFTSLVVMIVAS